MKRDDSNYVPPDDLSPEDEDPFLQDVTSEAASDDEGRFAPPAPDHRDADPADEGSPGETPIPDEPLFRPAIRWDGLEPPDRSWHVRGLIPGAQVTILGGDGGTGKSLLAQQLSISTATGRSWIGRAIERPGPALYLSAEDDEHELHRRVGAICAAEEMCVSDLGRFLPRSLAGQDALLATLDRKSGLLTPTGLFSRLSDALDEHRPTLLVLDTLADLHAGEENNRSHARHFIGLLRGLAIRYECAVVLLAHPSLSGLSSGSGTSGSTAWSNSVRSRLYLERLTDEGIEPDPDLRRLSAKKANYGRAGEEIALRWDAGRFKAEGDQTGLDRMAAQAKAQRVFLALLADFNAEGRRVRHTTGDGYAPNAFAKSGRAEGLSKPALRAAMEALFAAGQLRVSEEGPPSRKTKYIEEVPK